MFEKKKALIKEVIRRYITKTALLEEKKSFGNKNSQKEIYIVRRPEPTVGLFSYIITTLGHIYRATEMNYDIVIDMKNYINMYQQSKRDNAWEYFFEQPSGISLEEAYESKNVILSSEEIPSVRPSDAIEFFENAEERKKWHELYCTYIKCNAEIKQYIRKREEELFANDSQKKVLGVLCRGTDYTKLKPQNHPIQPTAEQVIEKIFEIKEKYRVDNIFLVTEDEAVLEIFKERFSREELKYIETKRFKSSKEEYLVKTMKNRKADIKQQGIDYLTQIALLAKCDYFIAGRTSGSVGVAIITEGFEYEYYWDLGRY